MNKVLWVTVVILLGVLLVTVQQMYQSPAAQHRSLLEKLESAESPYELRETFSLAQETMSARRQELEHRQSELDTIREDQRSSIEELETLTAQEKLRHDTDLQKMVEWESAINAETERLSAKEATVRDEIESLGGELTRSELELEAVRKAVSDARTRKSGLVEKEGELKQQISDTQRQISDLKRAISEANKALSDVQARNRELWATLLDLGHEAQNLRERIAEIRYGRPSDILRPGIN